MPLLIRNARVLTPEGVRPGASVLLQGGRIRAVGRVRDRGAERLDARGGLLGPGLIDVHINGAFGVSFAEGTPDEIRRAGRALLEQGITGYVPTLTSLPRKETERALGRIAEAAERPDGARILGIHLEGPYLNRERRGAHPPGSIRLPSGTEFRAFLGAARGRLRMMTIAPELAGAPEIIRQGRRRGVVMCAGHSEASAEQLERGIRAGIRHVTHLFNAMRPFHHREEGILDRALADDRLSCGVIYDRRHVSRSAMEMVLRCKPAGRAVLVSDAMFAMRAPDGTYRKGGRTYVVRDGTIRLSGSRRLSGSVASLLDGVRYLAEDLRLSPSRLFELASANPARLLGLRQGVLAPGRPADLVLFDRKWRVKAVFLGGRRWR